MVAAERLASLDILRGLTVVGMIAVNSSYGLQRFPVPAAMQHAHWIGLTPADLVFPMFIFLVGVSIAVSMPGSARCDTAMAQRIALRAVRLILLGIFLTNIYWMADYDANTFRWAGVLQRIGIVFLLAAPLHLVASTRSLTVIAALTLLVYWGVCLLPVPGGTAVDLSVPGANFIGWVDRAVFGSHIYVQGPLGYDPEGLLSTLPAVAQALLGVIAGRFLRTAAVSRFVWAGIAMIGLGLLWSMAFPISKDLWSSTFVLVTSGIALLLLAALHAIVDLRGRRVPAQNVWTAFGINAIAAYVLYYILSGWLGWQILDHLHGFAAMWVGAQWALIVPIGLFLSLIAWAMLGLKRRGWLIKI